MPFSNEVDVMSNFKHQIIQDRRMSVWKSERANSNVVGMIYPLILIRLKWSTKICGEGRGTASFAHMGFDSSEYHQALIKFLC